MKKICVVTGCRSDYGLLRWVIDGINMSPALKLQLLVTGAHLSPAFGMTVDAIEADGFHIDKKVEMLLSSDTAVGVTKSVGLGTIGFADALADLKPDLMVVLGDRYEILAAAIASMIARIPVAHIHGGEVTEGAIDDSIRHSITKMSHLHFVATDSYRKRVIQLGEQPERVFVVGGLGIDNIKRLKLLGRTHLEAELNFKFQQRNLLVTFHPVTIESGISKYQLNELLEALGELRDTGIIFTMPNADMECMRLFEQVDNFCKTHKNAKSYSSLGQIRYLSCLNLIDAVVGNSSSGIIEGPTFKVGTINIGDRQAGRVRASSVIDCPAEKASILEAFNTLYSSDFQGKLRSVDNPYGSGGASDSIVNILKDTPFQSLLIKKFHDLG